MSAHGFVLIPPSEPYRAGWRELFEGYATFYQRTMTDEIAERVWSWLLDPAHELEGLIALHEDRPVGLAHFRRMPRPSTGADIGFLDDLFVAPDMRGGKLGEVLIDEVARIARERNWATLRWLTQEHNYRARTLYDRVGRKSAFILYELTP